MGSERKAIRTSVVGVMAVALAAAPVGAFARKTAQEERAAEQVQLPKCDKKYGAIAVVEPERRWWEQYGLGSPEALIKVFVNQSGCFTLVDRGKGMDAAKAERELASSGELRGRSNIGKGQIRAADYVLVPDLISSNKDSGGNALGGILGGIIGGVAGAVVGGINLKKKTADVVLTVTDVRSSEQVALSEGHSTKTDLGWFGGGAVFGGALAAGGASGYENTEIGQVITVAYLHAYVDMVEKIRALPADASAANQQQAVNVIKPGKMYKTSSTKSALVRPLEAGMMLYPTGQKDGVMWEVEDELGNKGWASSLLFELAK